jgi:hypothetical protein
MEEEMEEGMEMKWRCDGRIFFRTGACLYLVSMHWCFSGGRLLCSSRVCSADCRLGASKKIATTLCRLWYSTVQHLNGFGCADVRPRPEFGMTSDGSCLPPRALFLFGKFYWFKLLTNEVARSRVVSTTQTTGAFSALSRPATVTERSFPRPYENERPLRLRLWIQHLPHSHSYCVSTTTALHTNSLAFTHNFDVQFFRGRQFFRSDGGQFVRLWSGERFWNATIDSISVWPHVTATGGKPWWSIWDG